MKTHSRDGGTPPLSSKNAIKPGPGDMFGTTGTGPGAHGLQGLAEPSHAGKTGPARNSGSHVAQTHGSPSKDNASHTAVGVLGSDKRDTPRG